MLELLKQRAISVLAVIGMLAVIILLGRGWVERDRIIKHQEHEISFLQSKVNEKQKVHEEITKRPDGTVIIKRDKVIERTKVLTEKTDKTKVSEIKEPSNGFYARYSLGIEFRHISFDRLDEAAQLVRRPTITVMGRIGTTPIFAGVGYDFYDRSLSIGMRMDF